MSSSGIPIRARAGTSPARTTAAADFWVVKLDGAGAVQWQKAARRQRILRMDISIQQTADGGYVLLGYSHLERERDVTGTNHGNYDYWVVKLDGAGDDPVAETARRQRKRRRILRAADGRRRIHSSSGIQPRARAGTSPVTNHGGSDFWAVETDRVPSSGSRPGWNFVSVPAVLASAMTQRKPSSPASTRTATRYSSTTPPRRHGWR